MKIDGGLMGDLAQAGQHAAKLEGQGYNGVVTAETSHDPFFPLLLAAQETSNIQLTTSIAVAFSRTPMNLANIGHDLNSFSKGRFILGLGSQIRPHITKRFSMPWSKPAARMREFISAMRAIWACWHDGTPLQFEGDFYTHSLMTPMFTPLDTEYGAPKVFSGCCGSFDDRSCRGSGGWGHYPCFHDREVPPRGDVAGGDAWTRKIRPLKRRF